MPAVPALLALLTSTAGAPLLPYAEISAEALAPDGMRHQEALRIDRDFGKPEFDLVVDTWMPERNPSAFADVRLWWVKTTAADRRSPLSTRAQKYVEIDTKAQGPDRWLLAVTGDHKRFAFEVELGDDGRAAVFTDIVDERGQRVEHCRARSGFLHARRFMGLPVGIARLSISCVDDQGRTRDGNAIMDRARR